MEWFASPVRQLRAQLAEQSLAPGRRVLRLWADGSPAASTPIQRTHTAENIAMLRSFEEIEPYLDIPFAVLGCSVGALVGFELARRLDQIHAIQPTHLFVCANRAPQLVHRGARVHALPTNQFIDAVRELAGTPDEVFQNQELVELVLPTLRADFALYETYKFEPKSALTCPITVFGGDEDPTTSAAGLMAWRKVTSDQCTVRIFNAGHFVLQAHAAEIAKEVSTALGRDWTLEAQPLW